MTSYTPAVRAHTSYPGYDDNPYLVFVRIPLCELRNPHPLPYLRRETVPSKGKHLQVVARSLSATRKDRSAEDKEAFVSGPKKFVSGGGARGQTAHCSGSAASGHRDDAPARYHSAVSDIALAAYTPPSPVMVQPTFSSAADSLFLYNRPSFLSTPSLAPPHFYRSPQPSYSLTNTLISIHHCTPSAKWLPRISASG